MQRRARLIELNDHFRNEVIAQELGVPVQRTLPGRIRFTEGTWKFSNRVTNRLLKRVLKFDDFEEDNEFEEHDFGIFKMDGISFNWQIDYYGEMMCLNLVPLPHDLRKYYRLLTIFLADEY